MSNTNDQLSRRDQLLIESYKEQTTSRRHEDNLFLRFTSVILPLSIAALGIPYVNRDVPDLLATLGGLTLMTFWAILSQITHVKSKIRFSIINEIERYWDVPSHKDFEKRRDDIYGKKLKSHFLRCCTFWIYLVIIAGLTIYKWVKLGPAQKDLIIDIIVPLAIVVLFGILTALAMCKARKKVRVKSKDKTDSSEKGS